MSFRGIKGLNLQFLVHDSLIHGCPSIPNTLNEFFNKLIPNSKINIGQHLVNKAYEERYHHQLKQQYLHSESRRKHGEPLFKPYLTNNHFKELISDIYRPFLPRLREYLLFSWNNSNNLFNYLVKYYNHCFQQSFRNPDIKDTLLLLQRYRDNAAVGLLIDSNWLNFNLDTSNFKYTYLTTLRQPDSVKLSDFQHYKDFENIYNLDYQFQANVKSIKGLSNILHNKVSTNAMTYLIINGDHPILESLDYKIIKISVGSSNVSDLLLNYTANLDNFDIQMTTLLNIYQVLLLKNVLVVNDLKELRLLIKVLTSMVKLG